MGKPKIRTKFLLIFISIIVLPLIIVSTIVNIIFSRYMISSQTANLNHYTEKINSRFQEFVKTIDELSMGVIANPDIQSLLEGNKADLLIRTELNSYFKMLKTNSIIDIIFIDNSYNLYNDGFNYLPSLTSILNSQTYKKLKNTAGELILCKDDIGFASFGDKYGVVAARKVNYLNSIRNPGILIVKIKYDKLREICSITPASDYAYVRNIISDSYGEILYDSAEDSNTRYNTLGQYFGEGESPVLPGAHIIEFAGERTLMVGSVENTPGWRIISTIPYSRCISEVIKTQVIIFWVTVFFILLSILIAVVFSYNFTNPINMLVKKMRLVRTGEYPTIANISREDEIGELCESFNKMSADINKLISMVKEEQEHARLSELNSLIHQINPHFLYNTLDNINMLAQMADEPKISGLITALSKLLRISLSKGKGIIPVKDEIEHARNYLIIQKMRFGNLFDYEIKVQDELMDKTVLKLIIQPLIENSIVHGFKNRREGGIIEISGCIDSGLAVFKVADNGSGMSDIQLYELNTGGDFDNKINSHGYGIKNINSRIRLLYGDGYSVHFERNFYNGITGVICLPL